MLSYPVLSLRSVGPCRLLVSRLLVGTLLSLVVWLTGELSPTPGIPVDCFAAALTHSGKANSRFVGTNGHHGAVGDGCQWPQWHCRLL
jgi:hypothetical protein